MDEGRPREVVDYAMGDACRTPTTIQTILRLSLRRQRLTVIVARRQPGDGTRSASHIIGVEADESRD